MHDPFPPLASARLSGNTLTRDIPVPERYRGDGYVDRFDATTLWYDAIWADGVLRLICPKLLNLEAPFRQGALRLDGAPVAPPRIRRFRRHDIVELAAPRLPGTVALDLAEGSVRSAVNPAQPARFAGRNVFITVSQDNPLGWLTDHARFHMARHRLDAVILLDNASQTYGPDEIHAAYSAAGIDTCIVISLPFPYGPVGKKPHTHRTKYLQTAILNAMRLRFLGQARAVLQCDIDELVHCRTGSVFDATVQSRLGYMGIPGIWTEPPADAPRPPHFRNHTHTEQPPRPTEPKYCIVPGGPLRRLQWDVHGLERLPFRRQLLTRNAVHWHCRGMSTGWKYDRDRRLETLAPDPEAMAVLTKVFPG